ncbi:MAG: hypothetical protein R3A80_04015 [Bdellovibrionota bacterium]
MFPISVTQLADFLPHQGKAIWITDVLDADANSGVARVSFSTTASFAYGDTLIESCYLEWMAQSFGYVSAAQRKLGLLNAQAELQDAFLAAVKNYSVLNIPRGLSDGDEFIVRVKATHVVGPVTLVEGAVERNSETLATAQLKLFAIPKN